LGPDAQYIPDVYALWVPHCEIAGNGKFAWIADQVASLPTNPILNMVALSEHFGLIKRNIRFLKEKTCLICHSLGGPEFYDFKMTLKL
jgi:hypothetical protein